MLGASVNHPLQQSGSVIPRKHCKANYLLGRIVRRIVCFNANSVRNQHQVLAGHSPSQRRLCTGQTCVHRANLLMLQVAEYKSLAQSASGRPQTSTRPPPDRRGNAEGRRMNEECQETPPQCPRQARVLHSAFFILPSPGPPQCDPNAPTKRQQSPVQASLPALTRFTLQRQGSDTNS